MWSAGRPCAAQAEIAAGRGPAAAREGTRRPHALTPNPGGFSWARKQLKSWFNNFSAAHPIFHYQKWLWKVLHSKIFHVCISISEMIQEDFFFFVGPSAFCGNRFKGSIFICNGNPQLLPHVFQADPPLP